MAEKKPGRSVHSRLSGLDIKLSKSLSYILRHGAEKEGIRLDEGGFAFVDDILARPHLKRFTFTDVERVVADNDKQRFSLIIDKDTGRSKIRANQGHTLEIPDLELIPLTKPKEVPIAVHGTYLRSWEMIRVQGLSRMKRNHIHLAPGEPGESGVISGMRSSCEVLIGIDTAKALEAGIKFFKSANNVILSPGNEKGLIPPEFFRTAVRLKGQTREQLEF
ncbi:tRNA 2'-phosphotransferase 1-like [Corticium candelabrum]|uniref:tRNA 2'-phosphotransferase 1-like n=1 Tax=Corticium candelabrum TaxID=121492 RepID=UPI002E26DE74|nr:tRNA 2'-phosphotransferase 1-like [Corticium candelabrum]